MQPFAYARPASIEEAVALLSEDPEARVLAGGMSLLPMVKQQLARPTQLVDLGGIADLKRISRSQDALVIGALARHYDVASSETVAATIPALASLASGIGDVQVRHRGTIGGSVANNDPAADYSAACVALAATIVTDRRRIEADDFFVDMFETALEPAEIVTGVEFPVPQVAAYRKFRHPISRYALVGVFIARLSDGAVRIAVTGAASCVFRVAAFEAALSQDWSPEAIAELSIDEDEVSGDIHASAAYRAHMIRHLALDIVRSTTTND